MFNSKLKAQVADLKEELKHSREANRREVNRLTDQCDSLRRKLQQKHEPEMVEVKTMIGLKFYALYKGTYMPTVFTTGLGKCGKTVKSFSISKGDRTLTIHQHHTDGSSKDFEYRLSDIDGRIQYDYEMTKVPRSETIEFRGSRWIK